MIIHLFNLQMKTAAIFTMMLVTLTGSCLMVRMFSQLYVKTISVGAAILVEYICLRYVCTVPSL